MKNNKISIRAWWWGRVIPETCKHLTNLSSLSDDEFDELEDLKQIYLKSKEKGIKLDWGYQFQKKHFFRGKHGL